MPTPRWRPFRTGRARAGPAPGELLAVDTSRDGDTTVVTVAGELDLHTVPALRRALHEAVRPRTRLVVVDLEHVTFMASAAVAELLAGLRHARATGCELRLAAGGRAVHVPIRLTGSAPAFEHYPSVADAARQPLVGA